MIFVPCKYIALYSAQHEPVWVHIGINSARARTVQQHVWLAVALPKVFIITVTKIVAILYGYLTVPGMRRTWKLTLLF